MGYDLLSADTSTAVGAWQALPLGTNIINTASGSYAPAGVRSEMGGNLLRLRGRIEPTASAANGDILATLPAGLRPVANVSTAGRWSGGTAILTIDTAGLVKLATALVAGNWITLDGLTFPLT